MMQQSEGIMYVIPDLYIVAHKINVTQVYFYYWIHFATVKQSYQSSSQVPWFYTAWKVLFERVVSLPAIKRKEENLLQGDKPTPREVFGDFNCWPHFLPLCQVRKKNQKEISFNLVTKV